MRRDSVPLGGGGGECVDFGDVVSGAEFGAAGDDHVLVVGEGALQRVQLDGRVERVHFPLPLRLFIHQRRARNFVLFRDWYQLTTLFH